MPHGATPDFHVLLDAERPSLARASCGAGGRGYGVTANVTLVRPRADDSEDPAHLFLLGSDGQPQAASPVTVAVTLSSSCATTGRGSHRVSTPFVRNWAMARRMLKDEV